MEIKPTSTSNHPNLIMINKLAKLLPLLVIAFAVPTLAASNYTSPDHAHRQIVAGHMAKHLGDLNLTPEQKTKMQQLRTATRSRLDAVLTPEQRQKIQQTKGQRPAKKQGEYGANLTADQKAKIKAIRQASRDRQQAILTPAQQAQLGQGGENRGKGRWAKLNLTPEQKTKMQQLRAETRAQMDAIRTPEQQQQAKTRREWHRGMKDTWKGLNLTADQKAEMKAIRSSSEQQFNAILTPAQQAQHQAHHHRGGRHHRM